LRRGRNPSIFQLLPGEVFDVSGAGDTVISVATMCLALEQQAGDIAALSNLAGGIVCEEVGVVPIDKNKFHDEVLRLMVR